MHAAVIFIFPLSAAARLKLAVAAAFGGVALSTYH
jgi:hypothetical protein